MRQGFDRALNFGLPRVVCCRHCSRRRRSVLQQLLLCAQLIAFSSQMATQTWVSWLHFLLQFLHQGQDCRLLLVALLQLDETGSRRADGGLERHPPVSLPCQISRYRGQSDWGGHFQQRQVLLCGLDSYEPTSLTGC
jgi:hypothetical protein